MPDFEHNLPEGAKERIEDLKRQLSEAMRKFGTDRITVGHNGIAEVFVRFDPTAQKIIEFGSTQNSVAQRYVYDPHLAPKMIIFDMKIKTAVHTMPDGTKKVTVRMQFPPKELKYGNDIDLTMVTLFNDALAELNVEMKETVN